MATPKILHSPAQVLMCIVGPVDPVGDASVDAARLENLDELTTVIDAVMTHLSDLAADAGSHEHSVAEIGRRARDFVAGTPWARDGSAPDDRTAEATPAPARPPSHSHVLRRVSRAYGLGEGKAAVVTAMLNMDALAEGLRMIFKGRPKK